MPWAPEVTRAAPLQPAGQHQLLVALSGDRPPAVRDDLRVPDGESADQAPGHHRARSSGDRRRHELPVRIARAESRHHRLVHLRAALAVAARFHDVVHHRRARVQDRVRCCATSHTGDASRNVDPNQINQGRDYTFRNGVPTNVRIWAVPYAWEEDGRDLSFFVQDQWTIGADDAEPGRALQRRSDVAARSPPGARILRRCARAAGGEEPAALEEPQPACRRRLRPRRHRARPRSRRRSAATIRRCGRRRPTRRRPASRRAPNRTWNDANGNFVPDCNLLESRHQRRVRRPGRTAPSGRT